MAWRTNGSAHWTGVRPIGSTRSPTYLSDARADGSYCLCGGDRFLLAPSSSFGHGGLALLRADRAVEVLRKSAPYCNVEAEGAELVLVGIDVCKTGKARRGAALAARWTREIASVLPRTRVPRSAHESW